MGNSSWFLAIFDFLKITGFWKITGFEKPVIFIDVPKKILNPDSNYISLEPIEITNRDKIGHVVNPNNLRKVVEIIENIHNDESKKEEIRKVRSNLVYNLGNSAEIGSNFLKELLNDLNQKDKN